MAGIFGGAAMPSAAEGAADGRGASIPWPLTPIAVVFSSALDEGYFKVHALAYIAAYRGTVPHRRWHYPSVTRSMQPITFAPASCAWQSWQPALPWRTGGLRLRLPFGQCPSDRNRRTIAEIRNAACSPGPRWRPEFRH